MLSLSRSARLVCRQSALYYPRRWTKVPASNELRSFEDIPGPKGLPLIGNTLSMFLDKSSTDLLEQIPKRYKKYGRIFRMDLGPRKAVAICTPQLVEDMFRQEDKYPVRDTPPAIRKYFEELGYASGISSEGEEWFRARKLLSTKLLRPREIDTYVPKMNDVVTDFTQVIENLKEEQGVISDLRSEIFGWSLEMMGTVALGTRLGAVGEGKGAKCSSFITSARETIKVFTSPELMVYPEWLMTVYKSKNLKTLEKHLDVILDFTKERVREKMGEFENEDQSTNEKDADMITYLLAQDIPFREVISNILAMLLAAVDTTSHAAQWALYCLASNPEAQEKLYEEISKQMKPRKIPSAEDINKLSYLKIFLKETQRMFPIATVFHRRTTTDVALGGYRVPPNTWVFIPTHFHAHHPDYFPDPEVFRPERWSRSAAERPAPFASTPFGLGNRSCLGRRVADVEILLLLARVCLKYNVQHIGEKPNPVIGSGGVLMSEKPIQLKFIGR